MEGELNPQQLKFKKAYCTPSSPTFGNAYRSALEAGYGEEYSKNITAQGNDWLSEILRERELLQDSEKALKEALNFKVQNEDGKVDPSVAAIKLKAATFTAETLGKSKYSKRSELTGADGKDLPTPILNHVPSNNSDKEGNESQETD